MLRFDIENLAQPIGYVPERVHPTLRALVGSGHVRNAGPGGSGVPPYYQLTSLGYGWAMGGFQTDMGLGTRIVVSVNLQLEIEQTIDVIAQLPISAEQKRAYELIVLKLERELSQGKLFWATFKDALGAAADGHAVGIPLFKLLANHKDQILHALSQMPVQ